MPQVAGGGAAEYHGRLKPTPKPSQVANAAMDYFQGQRGRGLAEAGFHGGDGGLIDTVLGGLKAAGAASNRWQDRLLHGLAGIPSSLGQTADSLFSGETSPGEAATSMYNDFTTRWDPRNLGESFGGDPAAMLGDIGMFAGAAAGVGGLQDVLANSAARGGFADSAAFLGDERGAIGPFGKAMEEAAARGESVSGVRNATLLDNGEVGILPAAQPYMDYQGNLSGYRPSGSISKPNYGAADVGTGEGMMTGPAVLKPDDWTGQIGTELATQELNRLAGSPVRMPGSMRGEFPFARWNVSESPDGNFGTKYETRYDPADVDQTNGLVVEALPIERPTAAQWATQNHAESLQDILMQDYVTANMDRTLKGHNLPALEGEPLAIDFGMGFRRTNPDFNMGEWTGMEPTPAQWPGYKLGARHEARLAQYKSILEDALNPGPGYNVIAKEIPAENIQAAIDRINAALGRDTLFAPDPLASGPMNAAPGGPIPGMGFPSVEPIPGGLNPGSFGNANISFGSPLHSSEIFNAPTSAGNPMNAANPLKTPGGGVIMGPADELGNVPVWHGAPGMAPFPADAFPSQFDWVPDPNAAAVPNTPLPTLMERLHALQAQIRALEERNGL